MKIDKKVPLPKNHSTRNQIYPFDKMGVGDSVSIPSQETVRMRSAAWNYGRRHGSKYTVRKISPTEWRLWRIK